MPGLVEGDDAVIGREHLDLVLPVLAVAAPAVQEDEGRVALAADLPDDLQPVAGPEGQACAIRPERSLRVLVC